MRDRGPSYCVHIGIIIVITAIGMLLVEQVPENIPKTCCGAAVIIVLFCVGRLLNEE